MDVYVSGESLAALDKLMVDLSATRTELENESLPLKRIKEYMNQRWIQNFVSEGRIYASWAALSPTWTIPERGTAHPILQRTGGLFAHFVEQNEEGQISPGAIHWSFNNIQGGWTVRHDEGYPNPIANRRDIPARPLWDINNQDEQRMEREISLYVDDVLRSHQL